MRPSVSGSSGGSGTHTSSRHAPSGLISQPVASANSSAVRSRRSSVTPKRYRLSTVLRMSSAHPELEPFTVEAIVAEATRRDRRARRLRRRSVRRTAGTLPGVARTRGPPQRSRTAHRSRTRAPACSEPAQLRERSQAVPGDRRRADRGPVFIIGFPRTGTTILHDILAQDPDSRAPLTWETMFPSPPPDAATFYTDPRIARARPRSRHPRRRRSETASSAPCTPWARRCRKSA